MSETIPHLSSSASDNSTTSYPLSSPPLFSLVKKYRWKKLKKSILLFNRNGKTMLMRHDPSCEEHDETGLNLLGLALGYHAPLDIIKTILTVDPNQSRTVDIYGANCLHLACLNGASPESVAYIVDHCTDLVTSRDIDQRVPLHHAVECICHNEIDFKSWSKIVDTLCKHNCDTIHLTDHNENSPLDLVHIAINQVSEFNEDESFRLVEFRRLEKVLKYLRRLSIDIYRFKKMEWESNRPSSEVTPIKNKKPGTRKEIKRRGDRKPHIIALDRMHCIVQAATDEEGDMTRGMIDTLPYTGNDRFGMVAKYHDSITAGTVEGAISTVQT